LFLPFLVRNAKERRRGGGVKVKGVQLSKIRGYPSHPFLARIAKERSGAK